MTTVVTGFRDLPLAAAKADVSNYTFALASPEELAAYNRLVTETYGPLGFMNDHADTFMPRGGTSCYVLRHCDEVVGSCALTPVPEGSVFHQHLPVLGGAQAPTMTELNNIILRPELRGGIGLALILYHATLAALADGTGLVVGITRYQTLRHFVEAGAIPISHEPLHLLGRPDLHDFIIYYDVRSEDARTYLRERARRLFGQAATLNHIRERLGKTRGGRTGASPEPMPITSTSKQAQTEPQIQAA